MDELEQLLINGGLAMLILEGVKLLLRRFYKDQGFDFSAGFYYVAIPVLNILVIPLLALLKVGEIQMPSDWVDWIRMAVVVLISSLVSLLFYNGGYKQLKEYSKKYDIV